MWNEKTQDLALGVLVLAIAIGGFVFINPTNSPVFDGPGGMSWRSLPYIYSGLLLFLGVIFIATTLIKASGISGPNSGNTEKNSGNLVDKPDTVSPEPAGNSTFLSTVRRTSVVVCLVLYSQLLDAFGFAMTTPFFLFAMLYTFGRKNLRENALVALIGGALLWILFDFLLKMPLRGHLWDPVTPALTGLLRAIGN